MAATSLPGQSAAKGEDYTPEILHMMLWGGFLVLLLAMLAPQFFSVSWSSDDVVNRAQWPTTSEVASHLPR